MSPSMVRAVAAVATGDEVLVVSSLRTLKPRDVVDEVALGAVVGGRRLRWPFR